MVISNEKLFSQQLKIGDKKNFEEIYKLHFKSLYCYAFTIVKDEVISEEIVQNVFLKIWERKDKIDIQTSIKAYLYKAVYFDSLNVLKHEKVKSNYQTQSSYIMNKVQLNNTGDRLLHNNLEEKLRNALLELPEQCRTVFQLSRFEELKYKEIATHLNISEKTVENHMGKALKLLRLKLVDFITIIVFIILHLKNNMH